MKQSESISNLATALSKAQGKMGAASMNSINPFFKSRYASLSNIMDACRAPLAENELCIFQTPTIKLKSAPIVRLTTTLAHSSGEYIRETISLPLVDEKGKSTAQAAGSVITYLRRYALSAMLGIVADEDTDGNEPPNGEKTQLKAKAEPSNNQKPSDKPALKPTKAQIKKLNTVGSRQYGDAWDDKRPKLVQAISKGRTRSSTELTRPECTTLIEGIMLELDKTKAG
jgi:hypothetical protein